jgi:glutaminyl-tRNA synthetase
VKTSRTEDPVRNPDGTADATKENVERKPHPSKKIDLAASQAPQGGGQGEQREGLDFIRRIVEEDGRTGKWNGRVATRFPPEPNGYLHIGHAKSICLNFGIAEEYNGTCNLRYDDTNPEKEEQEYVKSIEADVRWLGFTPAAVLWASDYFDTMYEYALELIRKGLAYVDDLTAEQIREYRGTLTSPGRESPFRNRSVKRTWTCSSGCARASSPTGRRCYGPKSTWRRRT